MLPDEAPPHGAESQFTTDFGRHNVPYSEIFSGGPPKDGIPAIDAPQFTTVDAADTWLAPQEPVILLQVGDDARAYPIQILMWHEIVNDTVGGVPVTLTYCPLCKSVIAFERAFEGQVLDFGTTGRLRYSNMVMYDRQTESWWQQATGEAIAGELTGRQLAFVPASVVSWADFRAAHPGGEVLSQDTGYSRDYGRNPYAGYDSVYGSPDLYHGPATPDVLPPMAAVMTVDLNQEAVAYPFELLQAVHAVNDTVGGVPIVVLWAPGTGSALGAPTVDGGRDVGAAAVFLRELGGQTLTFVYADDRFMDEQTGTEWSVLGRAVSGPSAGSQLTLAVGISHFWFSWAAFRPETRIYGSGSAIAADPAPVRESEISELTSDFEIIVYQGQDTLGGESIRLSELLAQGKPVVVNLWAGLCPVCRVEMPSLQDAFDEHGDSVLFVGVDIGPFVGLGTEKDGRALLNELGITFPAGTTPDATVVRNYNVLGTPTTLFFNPDGEVIRQWTGVLTPDQLDGYLATMLEGSVSS